MSGEGLRASGVLLVLVGAVLEVVIATSPTARPVHELALAFALVGAVTLAVGARRRPRAVPGRVAEGWSMRNVFVGAGAAVAAALALALIHALPDWLPVPDAVVHFGLLGAPLAMFVLVSYDARCVRCGPRLTYVAGGPGHPAVWYCARCRQVAIARAPEGPRVHLDAAAERLLAQVPAAGRPRAR